jgi:hypothetical protein
MSYTGVLGTIPSSQITQPTGSGGDQIFFQNGKTINNSYTVPANTNAGTFGPITIVATATVTVPSTSNWTVI